jgi:hypothetical protein
LLVTLLVAGLHGAQTAFGLQSSENAHRRLAVDVHDRGQPVSAIDATRSSDGVSELAVGAHVVAEIHQRLHELPAIDGDYTAQRHSALLGPLHKSSTEVQADGERGVAVASRAVDGIDCPIVLTGRMWHLSCPPSALPPVGVQPDRRLSFCFRDCL